MASSGNGPPKLLKKGVYVGDQMLSPHNKRLRSTTEEYWDCSSLPSSLGHITLKGEVNSYKKQLPTSEKKQAVTA
eukprot:6481881-Amphidinium_carterae.1